SNILMRYQLKTIYGDRGMTGWVFEAFQRHGVTYEYPFIKRSGEKSYVTRSEAYQESAPLSLLKTRLSQRSCVVRSDRLFGRHGQMAWDPSSDIRGPRGRPLEACEMPNRRGRCIAPPAGRARRTPRGGPSSPRDSFPRARAARTAGAWWRRRARRGLLRVGAQAQPRMSTAVEVQQLAEARPGLAPAAMPAPGAALAHQAGLLQCQLHEAG